jgi:hypothetical protein
MFAARCAMLHGALLIMHATPLHLLWGANMGQGMLQ